MSSTPISRDILEALTKYTASLKNKVSLVLQTGEHSKRAELASFLNQICGVSEKLLFLERDFKKGARSPLTFFLESNEGLNGISFSGIPSGHEFNSLILAILHSGGSEIKLDQSIKDMLSNVKEELRFETVVSLSCHNCPDVVQALNQFSIISPKISNEMIDGGLYPDLMKERDIQGVPCVYLNGEVFASGKSDIAKLVSKLEELYPYLKPQLSKSLPLQDVAIVGGGPAGISAAIYIARKGLSVALIAEKIGGQVKETMGIENLISVSNTTGDKLTVDMKSHLSDYDVTLKEHLRVTDLRQGAIKKITLSSGEIIEAKTLIIATGAKWRELGVPGEKENIGNGVAYCPHCDGPFFKGKDVAVIGGGNSGIEAALDLSGIVKKVTVLEFMPDLKADKILIDQAEKKDNIQILSNVQTKKILSTDGRVTGLEYKNRTTNKISLINLDGVFIQIGLIPNSQFMKDVIKLNKHGEIIINEHGETSEEGIFACGDVTTVPFKQIIISMGEGAKAALSASDYLMKYSPKDVAV
jgi:alkyl hydroperoxide reductase subunit F